MAEGRRCEEPKKRPSSAPKSSEMTSSCIPKIVLEDRDRGALGVSNPPLRTQSDLGLPACSMPNLALQQLQAEGEEGGTGAEKKLGVYCSPRMTRRSVDFEVASKGELDWLSGGFDPSNSLHVLTSNSRVGSAVSLNSEYTARSIGLISNDSDDDSTSVSDKFAESSLDKQPLLRRYLSYPEENAAPDASGGSVTRSTKSCADLKDAQEPIGGKLIKKDYKFSEEEITTPSDSTEIFQGEDGLCVLKHPHPKDGEEGDNCSGDCVSHIVCYRRGQRSLTEGRIRQWLQDIDETQK